MGGPELIVQIDESQFRGKCMQQSGRLQLEDRTPEDDENKEINNTSENIEEIIFKTHGYLDYVITVGAFWSKNIYCSKKNCQTLLPMLSGKNQNIVQLYILQQSAESLFNVTKLLIHSRDSEVQ